MRHDDFFNQYRGRYSQYWKERMSIIPHLPQSFDNANDIYELMSWLQKAFKHLLDDFQNLELEFEEFKNAITELIEVLVPQIIREFVKSEEFRELITEIIREWYSKELKTIIKEIQKDISELYSRVEKIETIIEVIENKIKEIEKIIDELIKRIEDIEKTLQGILGSGYVRLVQGVDYDVLFHNDFYTASKDITVQAIELYDRFMIKISANNDEKTYLEHKDLNKITLRHSKPIVEVMESNILSLRFKGKYKQINKNSSVVNSSGRGLWNVRPFNLRASWEVTYGRSRNLIDDYPFTLCGVSYADGYNSDFNIYNSKDIYLESGNFNYDITFMKSGK